MKTYTFKTNINCMNCVNAVTPALNILDNVETWKVDTENPEKILHITLDDENVESVVKAVANAGYQIEPV